jgi:hypothetical protein
MDESRTAPLDVRRHRVTAPESKVARRAQLCASHWVQGSPLPPAAQAIIIFFATFLIGSLYRFANAPAVIALCQVNY